MLADILVPIVPLFIIHRNSYSKSGFNAQSLHSYRSAIERLVAWFEGFTSAMPSSLGRKRELMTWRVQQMFCLPLLLCIMTDAVLAPPRKKQGIMRLWCFSIVQLDFVHWKQKTYQNFSVSFGRPQTDLLNNRPRQWGYNRENYFFDGEHPGCTWYKQTSMYAPPDMDCLAVGVEVVGEGSTETRLVSTSKIRKSVMPKACYYCSEMVKKESFQSL